MRHGNAVTQWRDKIITLFNVSASESDAVFLLGPIVTSDKDVKLIFFDFVSLSVDRITQKVEDAFCRIFLRVV